MSDPAVREAIALVRSRPALPSGGRLLCIDGPAGSGKTTLAGDVVDAFGGTSEVIHMDDLYAGWSGLTEELHIRTRDQIAAPFASGSVGSWRRYDWEAGAFAELHEVSAVDLLVLEGVGSGARQLAPFRTCLVWVSAPAAVRVPRGMARDRALHARPGLPWDLAGQESAWRGFVAEEQRYFAAHGLPAAADQRVDGTRTRGD